MSQNIPPEIINEIQDRCDIVELVASYLPLKKAGRNFKTNCPFHHEKTPSFTVSPEKQIYHCFGCGEGGNVIGFLMKYERMQFREALEILAKKAGVTLPQTQTNDQQKGYINQLYRINELACDFFQSMLSRAASPKVKSYLTSRDVSEKTILKFKLGFALNQWDSLLNFLRSKSASMKLIEKSGLVVTKKSGGYIDRFRNKLMIPIFDVRNRVIGFGARTLDDSLPKYVNSPETPIYYKGRVLFGLNGAKESIRSNDLAVIVEGYFDVITPMQQGFLNIVASSGTALTTEQIRLLRRYTRNVVVVFDADKAGELASLRSLELFLEEQMNVKIARLPEKYDPDSFVRKFGIDKFKQIVANANEIFEYKLNILLSKYNKNKPWEKTELAIEMLTTIKKIKNEILKSEYIKKLSERLKIDEQNLITELQRIKSLDSKYIDRFSAETKTKHYTPINSTEHMLIKLIIDDTNTLKQIKEFIEPDELQDELLRNILKIIFDLDNKHNQIKPNQLISYLDDDISTRIISQLSSEDTLAYENKNREILLQDCIKRIKSNSILLACQNLQEEISSAQKEGNSQSLNRLMKEFNTLIKKRSLLHEKSKH